MVAWSSPIRLSTNGSTPSAARRAGDLQRLLQQRAARAGLAQEDRPDRQPGQQLEVVAQLRRALGERDPLAHGLGARRGVAADGARPCRSEIAARKRARTLGASPSAARTRSAVASISATAPA